MRAAVWRELADCLRQLCRDRLRSLFVQPPEGADDLTDALLLRGFRPSCAGISPTGSLRIDLGDDLATIRSRFGRKLRSWPHRWEARGVTVTVGDEADIPVLVRLMAHSAQRQGFALLPGHYVERLYRELAPTGNAVLFLGRVNGEPVAADLVTVCGDMIRGRLTGFERCGDAARLSVPAAVRWEVVKWGKQQGLRWLDFGGLAPTTLAALLDGEAPPPEVALSGPAQAHLRRHGVPLPTGRGARRAGAPARGLRPRTPLAPWAVGDRPGPCRAAGEWAAPADAERRRAAHLT